MLITSHSELESHISRNMQRIREYTGTLYYSYIMQYYAVAII